MSEFDLQSIRDQFPVLSCALNDETLKDDVMRESLIEKLRGWLVKL